MSRKPRLFFHVQHLLGIGHQMRAAAITRACMQAGIEVHYASGGFEDRPLDLGGAELHQLPPCRVKDGDFSHLVAINGDLVDDAWWEARVHATENLFDRLEPDLLLIEGFPFARRKFGRELLPLIQEARQHAIPVISSVRDILVAPNRDEKRLKSLDIAKHQFDHILVHGDPDFIPLETSMPGSEDLPLLYTGYVDGEIPNPDLPDDTSEESSETLRQGIVVSVGGGAVGEHLLEQAVEAARLLGDDIPWRLLAGPNLPDRVIHDLKDRAAGLNLTLEPARDDFRTLLSNARLSISQAGYNTVMDLMAAGCPSILVPFGRDGESEQPLRANLLEETGHAAVLLEESCTGPGLAGMVAKMLSKKPDLPPAPFRMDGAEQTARALLEIYKNRQKI